ncbi:hypothetical protein TNCV_537451 [Trichonephila clavipes]|nr:hypothetical protein TNCV_537451 [Trichonephila clavipes]
MIAVKELKPNVQSSGCRGHIHPVSYKYTEITQSHIMNLYASSFIHHHLLYFFSKNMDRTEMQFFGHFSSTFKEESGCTESGRYFWDTLYKNFEITAVFFRENQDETND